jgi:uncharacterized damage-inducible protein DinB
MTAARPEVWLRGPLPDVPAALQPAAHALLQAREELEAALAGFPDALLWERPAGVASVGFHLQHLAGVIDRMLTYARGAALSEAQFAALRAEGTPPAGDAGGAAALLAAFGACVDAALAAFRATDPATLADVRTVGRAALPSTMQGLLFHAAEHTQRHVGQLLVTARLVRAGIAPLEIDRP